MRDPRDGTLHAATNHMVYGATTHRSTRPRRDLGADRGDRPPRGQRAHLGEVLAHRAGSRRPAADALARRHARSALPQRRRRLVVDAGRQSLVEHSTPRALEPGRRRHVLPLDPGRSVRPPAALHRDLRRGRLPQRRRRRDLGAQELRSRGRFHARRPVPRGRPVRPQAARAPGQAGAPVAAEPLRRLPLRRPRRQLGAARGQRPPERLRLPDRARPVRPGRRLRRPRGRRREPRHPERPPRRLSHPRLRRLLGAAHRRAARSRPGPPSSAKGCRSTGSTRRRVPRHPEWLGLRDPRRRRVVGRGSTASSPRSCPSKPPSGRSPPALAARHRGGRTGALRARRIDARPSTEARCRSPT